MRALPQELSSRTCLRDSAQTLTALSCARQEGTGTRREFREPGLLPPVFVRRALRCAFPFVETLAPGVRVEGQRTETGADSASTQQA